MFGPACLRRRLADEFAGPNILGSQAISGGVRARAFLPTLGATAKSRSESGAESPVTFRFCNYFRVQRIDTDGEFLLYENSVVVIWKDFILTDGSLPSDSSPNGSIACDPLENPARFVPDLA